MEHFTDDVVKIAVTPRAGEHHHAEVHRLPVSPFGFRLHSTLYVSFWQESERAVCASLQHLHGEVLDHGVDEEPRAHLFDALARLVAVLPFEIEVEHLADADVAHLAKAETVQGALHRRALRVEDARLQPDEHPSLHGSVTAVSEGQPDERRRPRFADTRTGRSRRRGRTTSGAARSRNRRPADH